MQISFFATLIAIALYIGVSLLTCEREFPLNKMLHRDESAAEIRPVKRRWTLGRVIGFDGNFSRGDRWIAGGLFFWAVGWFCVMRFGSLWNLIGQSGLVSWLRPWSSETWLIFWKITGVGLPIVITVVTGVWFVSGRSGASLTADQSGEVASYR